MSLTCVFTVPASRDLEVILDRLAELNSVETAEQFLGRVNDKCRRLTSFPGLGYRRDELSPGMRSVPVADYLIFYRAFEDRIEILRVVSGYRDLDTLFEEE
ncbi:type II toxin-antitoxin system RelE/ParE family toxin [Synechococcus sp. PCC 7336]|uniref:type II toxin-antitoxin system RelE/ParE family toxin n=1 Tax=Synechococcus sp. PCC 7336 TaxID=195250 RepID=UPI000348039B|nr:type II toxin-antitoxin system RelE/ParE family toxin [Synechococcus sp. PCC 7336]